MNSCLFGQCITVLIWLAQLAICSYPHMSDSRDIPPGDTPFKLCNDSNSSDILSIDMIQLYPKPLLMYENGACELARTNSLFLI